MLLTDLLCLFLLFFTYVGVSFFVFYFGVLDILLPLIMMLHHHGMLYDVSFMSSIANNIILFLILSKDEASHISICIGDN